MIKPLPSVFIALLAVPMINPHAIGADALHFTSPIQELSSTEDAVDILASYVFTNSSDHAITISENKTLMRMHDRRARKASLSTWRSGNDQRCF